MVWSSNSCCNWRYLVQGIRLKKCKSDNNRITLACYVIGTVNSLRPAPHLLSFQSAVTCSKLTIEALEQDIKFQHI